MAGIYIHIPFCKQACYYCNFHFSTSLKNKQELVSALLKEITLQKEFFNAMSVASPEKKIVETIYLGGGTPSLLSANDIHALLDRIHTHFTVSTDCEITLEANPDDIVPEKIIAWQRDGVNRLSLGVQSFFDEDLKWMNRSHNATGAEYAIMAIQQAGFDNFSADLIFGMPTLPDSHWKENIARMTTLGVPHLSCYALTVEPRTPLDNFIRRKKYLPVSEEQTARQFDMLMDRLATAGYEHYEISNFALPGKRSKHNSHYWQGALYLGIGPSAHSYTGQTRQWNVANNALYIKSIAEDKIPYEAETLTGAMQLNEYIMTSLRTMEGCNLQVITAQWGEAESKRVETESKRFIVQKHMTIQEHYLVLTDKGKLFADGIAAELFCTPV